MKKLILASLVVMLSVPMLSAAGVAKRGAAIKSEPAPQEPSRGSNEETDPRQETYEGREGLNAANAMGGITERSTIVSTNSILKKCFAYNSWFSHKLSPSEQDKSVPIKFQVVTCITYNLQILQHHTC